MIPTEQLALDEVRHRLGQRSVHFWREGKPVCYPGPDRSELNTDPTDTTCDDCKYWIYQNLHRVHRGEHVI